MRTNERRLLRPLSPGRGQGAEERLSSWFNQIVRKRRREVLEKQSDISRCLGACRGEVTSFGKLRFAGVAIPRCLLDTQLHISAHSE